MISSSYVPRALKTPEYSTLAVEALDGVCVTVEVTSTSFASFASLPRVIELPTPPIATWQARHGNQRSVHAVASIDAAVHDYAKTKYGLHRSVWSSPSDAVWDCEHECQAKSWVCAHPVPRGDECWLAHACGYTYRQMQLLYWNGAPRREWWLNGFWRRETTNGYVEPFKREITRALRPRKPSRWGRFVGALGRLLSNQRKKKP